MNEFPPPEEDFDDEDENFQEEKKETKKTKKNPSSSSSSPSSIPFIEKILSQYDRMIETNDPTFSTPGNTEHSKKMREEIASEHSLASRVHQDFSSQVQDQMNKYLETMGEKKNEFDIHEFTKYFDENVLRSREFLILCSRSFEDFLSQSPESFIDVRIRHDQTFRNWLYGRLVLGPSLAYRPNLPAWYSIPKDSPNAWIQLRSPWERFVLNRRAARMRAQLRLSKFLSRNEAVEKELARRKKLGLGPLPHWDPIFHEPKFGRVSWKGKTVLAFWILTFLTLYLYYNIREQANPNMNGPVAWYREFKLWMRKREMEAAKKAEAEKKRLAHERAMDQVEQRLIRAAQQNPQNQQNQQQQSK